MHEPSDEASAAAAYLEVWRWLLVPLSRGRLACTRGRQTATLAFELPAEPEALPAGAQLQYASFELRREYDAGLRCVTEPEPPRLERQHAPDSLADARPPDGSSWCRRT